MTQPQVIELPDHGPPPVLAVIAGGLAAGLGLGIAVAVWQLAAGLSLAVAAVGVGSGVGLCLRGAALYVYHARLGTAEVIRARGEAAAMLAAHGYQLILPVDAESARWARMVCDNIRTEILREVTDEED